MERGDNESKGLTRTNRRKVVCSACGIHLNNDNKNIHVQRRHPGMKLNFLPLLESGQQTLNFWGASKTLNIADIRNENNNNSKAVDKSAEDSSYSDAENNTDVEVNEFADLEVGKVVAVENDKVSIVSTDEVTVSDSNEVPALEVNKVLEGEVDMVTETELANMAVSNVDTSEAHIEADADMVLNLESEADMTVEKSCAAIDKIVSELSERFNKEDQNVLTSLGKIIFEKDPGESSFDTVAEYYSLDKSLLEADNQFLRWYLAENECCEEFLPELHSSGVLDMMPELTKVIEILRSIPATSCSSERSFSTLRRIKTYLRNTIGQDRLSSIALVNIEREYSNRVYNEDIDQIIDVFGRRSARAQYFF